MMKSTSKQRTPSFAKAMPYILLLCGAVGLVLAAILMYETIQINSNPNYVPNCSLNPIINCGTVIKAETSFLHGYVNPIFGLIAFPVLITTGVVLLNKVTLKKWYWLGLQIGSLIGIGYIAWLLYNSFYRIHSLCPYCLGIWVVTITTFWYVTLYNLETGHIHVIGRFRGLSNFLQRHHIDVLILVFIAIAGWALHHFWYYYGHYL